MTKLELTPVWDKVFPKSDLVNHEKVTFRNRYGIELAADVYVPKNASGKMAAIAISGPFGAVKGRLCASPRARSACKPSPVMPQGSLALNGGVLEVAIGAAARCGASGREPLHRASLRYEIPQVAGHHEHQQHGADISVDNEIGRAHV